MPAYHSFFAGTLNLISIKNGTRLASSTSQICHLDDSAVAGRCLLWVKSGHRALVEGKNALPVVLHADDRPTVFLRLVVKRLRKGADLRIGESLRRAIGVFVLHIVVQHQHHQPRAIACSRVLQHLPIAGRVAKCRARAAADL
jgi:hypothetical protein